MIADAIIRKPQRIATRLGVMAEIMHLVMPKMSEVVMNSAYRMFPDSAAAQGKKDGEAPRPPDQGGDDLCLADARHSLVNRRSLRSVVDRELHPRGVYVEVIGLALVAAVAWALPVQVTLAQAGAQRSAQGDCVREVAATRLQGRLDRQFPADRATAGSST